MKQPEHFVNSTCRNIGHIWETTTSNTIRRCTSGHCHAIQRFEQGTWVTIPHPLPRPAKRHPVPQQASLF